MYKVYKILNKHKIEKNNYQNSKNYKTKKNTIYTFNFVTFCRLDRKCKVKALLN